jgi:hypothetical protein
MKLQYMKTAWEEVDISMFSEEEQQEIIREFKNNDQLMTIINWERTYANVLYETENCNIDPINGNPTRIIIDEDGKGIWDNGQKPKNNG